MRVHTYLLVLCSLVLAAALRAQAMSSSNFNGDWNVVDAGGSSRTSASFTLFDSLFQTGVGGASSASFKVYSGFQQDFDTPTLTPTLTPTSTSTATVTPSATSTVSPTFSGTSTASPSFTATFSPTLTVTETGSPTPTSTSTLTAANSATSTLTVTETPSSTATRTASPSATETSVPPNVTLVSPAGGSSGGGDNITISGGNFAVGVSVSFGGVSATIITATSSSLSVISPAHAAGTVSVAVTNPGGASDSGKTFAYAVPTATDTATPTATPSATPFQTVTDSPTAGPSPTPTFTWTTSNTPRPSPTADVPAVLDRNIFRPGKGSPLQVAFKPLENGKVTIHLFNLAGEKVQTIFDADVQAGFWQQAVWDGSNTVGETVASGVYFVSVKGGGIRSIRKVVVLK